ncbi:hypothetical protein M9435_001752 [Picochlorum sp. BPE23]|nr:hypothetical protein M9435_001752 [Picochlorum sp. BPE23]
MGQTMQSSLPQEGSAISLSSMLSEKDKNGGIIKTKTARKTVFSRDLRMPQSPLSQSIQQRTLDSWTITYSIIIVGSLSYLTSIWLLCYYLPTGDAIVVRDEFYSGIPAALYSMPTAAFACALFLNLSSLFFENHRARQQLCVLVTYISGVAFLYELLAWYGSAPIFLTASSRPHSAMRYIMWSHATPAMVYALSMVSEFSLQRTFRAMIADIFMILIAIPGEYCASWVLRYVCNTLSMAMFPLVMHEIWMMFTQAMGVALDHDRQGYHSLKALRSVTLLLWSIFPFVWVLCQFQLIDSVVEEGLLSLADVFGKIVFSSSLLQSNFVTIEARRRLASKAAEDANRTAVIYELQELLAQKEEFIAVVTHELRTPLNGIIGLSEALLASRVLDGANARSLSAIRNSGIRLLALVNDVLDAAAMKRGTLSIHAKRLQISKIIDDVLELTAALVSPGVKLSTRVSAITPPVLGDPQRLVQVLYNLVGNACKFTEEGEILIEASGTADDDYVTVKVRDTGVGIPENRLDDIFVPFSQGNMSLRRKYGGTGLGLSVVKHIVEAHGGSIRVESTEGEGSLFTFTIPSCVHGPAARSSTESGGSDKSSDMWKRFSLDSEARHSFEFEKKMLKKAGQQVEPEKAANVFANSKPSFPDLTATTDVEGRIIAQDKGDTDTTTDLKMKPSDSILRDLKDTKLFRILSVDDDPVNQMVVQAMLKNKGFEVSTAADGERALEMIEDMHKTDNLPDAVLLDVMMPGLSGFDVVRQVRSSYPEWKAPVLLVSASGQKEQIKEGMDSGADAYLTKPLKIEELPKTIKHYIRKAQASSDDSE